MNNRQPEPEGHLAMDDVSDFAQRFAPIRSSIPDARPPVRLVPTAVLHRSAAPSFTALQEMRDEADESGRWNDCADLEYDLRMMKTDAEATLRDAFKEAVAIGGSIPEVRAQKLTTTPVEMWITEALDTADGTFKAVQLVMSAGARERVIGELAKQYAKDNVEDLLTAGWTA